MLKILCPTKRTLMAGSLFVGTPLLVQLETLDPELAGS